MLMIPLYMAITDYPDNPDATARRYGMADAPWAVRLAARLLRELHRGPPLYKGPTSHWAPYMQV